MGDKRTRRPLFYLMILIVIFSLGLTAIILAGLIDDADGKEAKHWFFEESIQTGRPVELKNVYVFSNANNKLEFIYDDMAYSIDGQLEDEYIGVADIVVNGERIEKIRIKPDCETGVLNSYDMETICIERDELSSMPITEDVVVYKTSGERIEEADWEELIVGVSHIRCVLEKGKVCAIILEDEVVSEIRVILKNGKSIFYDNLYIKKKSENTLYDIKKHMEKNDLKELVLTDETGLYLCDSTGKEKGAYYEGKFRVIKEEEGYVLINILPIETYVKYVLPSEMPKYFEEEALKAQAVCARTFAYAHLSNQSYAKYGANLDDSTSFQVYHTTGRYAKTDDAVDATKGEIITYNGKPITCYYFSTSAGQTNDMSVWGSKTPEYITKNISEDINSPFYSWVAYLEKDDIKKIKIVKKNLSNYVTKVEIAYEDKTVTLANENDIRRALGKYLEKVELQDGKIREDLTMIPSASFDVVEVTSTHIILAGGGFGHGIGMSQYGANLMAKEGFGYKDIITYYYKGAIVKNV